MKQILLQVKTPGKKSTNLIYNTNKKPLKEFID